MSNQAAYILEKAVNDIRDGVYQGNNSTIYRACDQILDVARQISAQQPVKADAEHNADIDQPGVCKCHYALNFKPKVCATCGLRTT